MSDGRSVPVFVLVNVPGRSPLPVDESGQLLADLQRPGDGRRKAPVQRLAGVRLLHAVESVRTAALQRHDRRGRAGQHGRARGGQHDVRTAIPTTSPTRAAGCPTIGRTCSGRWAASTCRAPASWSPPTCSTSAASRGRRRHRSRCRRAISAFCSSRAARAGCRRSRCSICACRGRFAVGGAGRVELLLDVLNALNDTAEEGLATDNLFSVEFRSAHGVHGSASRDDQREAEPGPVWSRRLSRTWPARGGATRRRS